MIIIIDTDKVKQLNLSIIEYAFLFMIYNDVRGEVMIPEQTLKSLEDRGFIKDHSEGIILRKKTLDLFSDEVPVKGNDLSAFVDKYRDLFPAGVKSGNRLVKGDKHGCIDKMKKFRTKYPEYSQEEILEATKVYLDLCKKRNFDRMTSADYFIEKDKISQLASYCEDIRVRGKQTTSVDNKGDIGRTKRI